MGKGDQRSRRGKINRGSFGKNRRKKKKDENKKPQKKKQKKDRHPKGNILDSSGNVVIGHFNWKRV